MARFGALFLGLASSLSVSAAFAFVVVLLGALASVLAVPALAVSGVLLALSSHSAKASTRLVVYTSPEPVSNVAVSLGEDGLVFVVMAIAISRPELAVVVVSLLTVASVAVAFVFYRIARRAARRLRSGSRAATARRSRDDS